MSIIPAYRVQCSGPCRNWLSIPDTYSPGDDIPLATLEPQPTAERAGMWPDEAAARYAAFGAGWSGSTCPDCRAVGDTRDPSCASPGRRGAAVMTGQGKRQDKTVQAIVAQARADALSEAADLVGNDDDCDCGGCDSCVPNKMAADLRRRANEAAEAAWFGQTPAAERPDIQVWPLGRVLSEVRCGSQDWTWDEEWADLDHYRSEQLATLEQQIRVNGITEPLLIGTDGRLWNGHHRLRLAVRLNIPYVPVRAAAGKLPTRSTETPSGGTS